MGISKEAKIELLGAKAGVVDAPETEQTAAQDRVEMMVQAVDLIGRAFDLSRPKIVARDRDSDDADEQVNIVGKYQRWAINSLMRMFDTAIPKVEDDVKQQARRTYSLQHGRSRGVADEFAINQSLDWEDRHEEILAILNQLRAAANEGYEVVFDETYAPYVKTVDVTVPTGLSEATLARLAAKKASA